MEAPERHSERRDNAGKPQERRGAGPTRPRGEGKPQARQTQEPRRKRGGEQRYAGFGDSLERAFCTRAEHFLPAAFPVEAHTGAATIPRRVVARRASALLLCNYSHCGEHVWPDGEIVAEPATED